MEDKQTEKQESKEQPQKKLSFIEDLKRRKVFRVAITYAVVSWLIIQVAAATFENFGIPVWAFRFVVLMLVIGFPVAMILAWALELTPEGVKITRSAREMPASAEPETLNRKRNWYAIALAAGLPTLIFGTLSIFFYVGQSGSDATDEVVAQVQQDRPYVIGSIAVLPLTLIAEDDSIRNTAVGLQEEMLTALSEMSPLDVVSRTSTMKFSDSRTSIPEMGEALGADFIVEGSIQSVGDKIRVTLQLIQSAEDNHIWAETFDKGPEREEEPLVFRKELAYEMAIQVYQALETGFPPRGEALAVRQAKVTKLEQDLEEVYEQFWIEWMSQNWGTLYDSASSKIEQLLILDPDNKEAHEKKAGIMYGASNLGRYDFFDPEYRKAYYLVLKRAFAVNPDGFDTNKHLGIYYYLYENNPHKAIPYSRTAVGREREIRGSPDVYTYWILLEALCATGQSSAAMNIIRNTLEAEADLSDAPLWYWTRSYDLIGRFEEKIEIIEGQLEAARDSAPEVEIIGLEFARIIAEAQWTGSVQPILELSEKIGDNPSASVEVKGMLAFFRGDYDYVLDAIATIQPGTGFGSLMSIDISGIRAWAYLKTGNASLAKSYYRGYLNELESTLKGQWMKQYEPDVYASLQAFAYAALEDRETASEWAEKALTLADPSRHFEDYCDTIQTLARMYALLGDDIRACELLDELLSSPSGFPTGEVLIDRQFRDISDSPHFEAVIRKHADQLKDPAILDEYFPKAN